MRTTLNRPRKVNEVIIMSFQKKTSSEALKKLAFRLESVKTVDPDFDFGNGINATELETLKGDIESALNSYNSTLSDADQERDGIRLLEQRARDAAERLRAHIIAQYGRDSLEYQRIGGVRKSEINYTGSRAETYESTSSAEEPAPAPAVT